MSNPEDAVLAAIDGLELDEVGQIVKWQLEEGVARGEHLPFGARPASWSGRDRRFVPADPADPLGSPTLVLEFDFEPGARVGWEDADGVVHVETTTVVDPVADVAERLQRFVEDMIRAVMPWYPEADQ